MNTERFAFLRELKNYGEEKNIPNISAETGQLLHALVCSTGATRILEVGTANGYSTIWLGDAVESLGGRVVTVDFSEPSFRQAQKNIVEVGLSDTVELRFGNAKDLLAQEEKQYDFFFIDGQKAEYPDFWQLIKPLMAPGALVVFDDVLKFPEKTKEFWHLIQTEKEYDHLLIPVDGDDGILLLREKK